MCVPWLVAASATAVVWLTIGLVTTLAVVAMLVALVRHAILVGRAVGRFQDEVTPILEDMSREGPSAHSGRRIARLPTTRADPPEPR